MTVTLDSEHDGAARTGRSRMMRAIRLVVISVACLGVVTMIGLFRFAGDIAAFAEPQTERPRADGIVVLTGGSDRIAGGIGLLSEARGKRLLITGVNPNTTQRDIRRNLSVRTELFDCCIDLGYTALNTLGNAVETGKWAHGNDFSSLIVVTSSYHMPRTLMELGRELPKAALIAHPVTTERLDFDRWWSDHQTASIVVKEYAKYLLALVRIRLRTSTADTTAATLN